MFMLEIAILQLLENRWSLTVNAGFSLPPAGTSPSWPTQVAFPVGLNTQDVTDGGLWPLINVWL